VAPVFRVREVSRQALDEPDTIRIEQVRIEDQKGVDQAAREPQEGLDILGAETNDGNVGLCVTELENAFSNGERPSGGPGHDGIASGFQSEEWQEDQW